MGNNRVIPWNWERLVWEMMCELLPEPHMCMGHEENVILHQRGSLPVAAGCSPSLWVLTLLEKEIASFQAHI